MSAVKIANMPEETTHAASPCSILASTSLRLVKLGWLILP